MSARAFRLPFRARAAVSWLALIAGAGCPGLAGQQPVTLEQAVARAQAEGHQARAAAAQLEASRYRDRLFYSRLLPQLSLGGTLPSYNRSIIEVVQPDGATLFRPRNQTSAALTATLSQRMPITGGDLFVTSSLARLSVSGQQDLRTWSTTPVSVGVRQPILRPNLLAWDRREQPVRAAVAERQYLEAREDIAVETTSLFFDVYSARVALANATSNAAVNDTLYHLNRGRYEVGKIGENDLLQSELALLRARTALDGSRLEFERASAALRLALNLPPGAAIDVDVSAAVPDLVPDTTRAVVEALRNRAVIAESELGQVQAARRVNEARLANGVGATLTASFGFNATAPEVGQAYHNLLEARQLAVALDVPIWQWGARKENVRAAQAEQERTAVTAQSTRERTAQDAHFAALQLTQARRALALSAKADTVAGKRFEVAYNRYVIGRISIDNLYIAQNEKDQAIVQYVQALRGFWLAYYRLRRATLYDFEADRPIF